MAKVSREAAEVNARIVYWGISGAGKRTNLERIATRLRPDHRGDAEEVPTRFDPSVSYQVLPIELGEIAGVRTRIEMVCVPGEAEQAPTRKQLLDQVDGVVLVIDARPERVEENVACCNELRGALADYGRSLESIPLVVQYNRRDQSDPYVIEELHRRLELGAATVFEAVASEGTGLLQTLSTISKKVIRALREQKIEVAPRAPQRPPVPAPAPPVPSAPSAPSEMERAILEEREHPEAEAIAEQARSTETLFESEAPPWQGEEELEPPPGARIDARLTIVSVGEAERVGDRAIRVPLVLGDAEGETSTLQLTIQLDPLVDDRS